MELIKLIIQIFNELFCRLIRGHERESNGIDEGTFSDTNGWCKHCDMLM